MSENSYKMPSEEQKPVIETPVKSSMEILSELFNSFDAEPPVIIKKEKSDSPGKKSKKSKKKHKHKDKKHKKKDKKKKRDHSTSSEKSEIDLAEILIKQEKESSEQKIKIEGTDLSFNLDIVNVKKEKENKRDRKSSVVKSDEKVKVKAENSKKLEDGEVESEDDKKHKKRKHKSDGDKVVKKRKKEERSKLSEEKELQLKINDLRNKIKGNHRSRSVDRRSRSREGRSRSRRSRSRDDDFYKRREKSRERRSRDREKHKDYDYKNKRSNSFYKEEDFWSRERHKLHHDKEKRHHQRSTSRDSSHIDKKKLLEIARKNAIQMMKSGSLPGALTLGPQAQEKVIAAIRAGGKTIEELTDFCKTLSKQEELGELSSNSEGNGSDSDNDKPFHHPFQIKDRPTSITMNIKNSVPLPIKSTQERSSELRLQFPVSSGQLHRKTENEWVPVPPRKVPEPVPPPKPVEAPPVKEVETPTPPPGPQMFPQTEPIQAGVDIGSIVSQRLTAIRKLQENPNDVQALTQMYKSNKEMQSWAQSKQQPGQFTGTTGAQVLTQAELSSGFQAWAKKDQLTSATPVSGGMGMHLLQKMGWKPGEGLGKEKTGALEPLLLEVKLDKKGLVANEEQKKKKKQGQAQWNSYTIQNKHPVSLLGEYASKKKLGAPQYTLCFECGPDHKKNFLFKVNINGVEYKPNVASPNKKDAKAAAATVCLQHLGLLA